MQKTKTLSLMLACGMLMSLPFCSFAAEVVNPELLRSGASATEFVRPSDGARIKLATKAAEINRVTGGVPVYFFPAPAYDPTGGLLVGDTGGDIVAPLRFEIVSLLQGDVRLEKLRDALGLARVEIVYPYTNGADGKAKGELGFTIPKGVAAGVANGIVILRGDPTYFDFGTKEALDAYITANPAFKEVWKWDADGDVRLDFTKATLLSKQ